MATRRRKADRQAQIVVELGIRPAMRVHELAERLEVSVETIRRDLTEMDRRGQLNRTFGGAVRPLMFEPGLAERAELLVPERERIAAAAAQLVEPADILMIGGGATTLHFARRLATLAGHITVITHSFSIATTLAINPAIRILMLPGQYDVREGIIYGPETIDALQRFHASKAFIGATGLTIEGPNDASTSAGLIYGTMMQRASSVYVLADHSKFDRPSLTVIGPWSPLTVIVADQAPSGQLAAALSNKGVKTMVG